MRVKIRETGEIKELVSIDPVMGQDWSQDLVGNTGAFMDGRFEWDEEEDIYIVAQDEFSWWAKYISGMAEVWDKADGLASDLFVRNSANGLPIWRRYVLNRLYEAMGNANDMEDEPAAGLAELDVIRAEYGL